MQSSLLYDNAVSKTEIFAKDMRKGWHQAFYEAVQLELYAYLPDLTIENEHQLTMEPLRIDVLVVKKKPELVIDKSFARIFRGYNIMEFKSPKDYASVSDINKATAYAYLYASKQNIDIADVTLTIVEKRHPRDILEHFEKTWKHPLDETSPGVYIWNRDILPVQVIESSRLSAEDDVWLKNLTDEPEVEDIAKVLEAKDKLGKDPLGDTYAYWILEQNPDVVEEAKNMKVKRTGRTLEQVLEDTGYNDEIRSQIAQEMVHIGMKPDQISQVTKLPMDKVQNLFTQQVPAAVRA
jgi:hypothetical protein